MKNNSFFWLVNSEEQPPYNGRIWLGACATCWFLEFHWINPVDCWIRLLYAPNRSEQAEKSEHYFWRKVSLLPVQMQQTSTACAIIKAQVIHIVHFLLAWLKLFHVVHSRQNTRSDQSSHRHLLVIVRHEPSIRGVDEALYLIQSIWTSFAVAILVSHLVALWIDKLDSTFQ